MKLIIAEKPSLARTIADSLYSVNDIVVLSAQGHLLELMFPKDKNWSLDKLPLKGTKPTELRVIDNDFKKKLINTIKETIYKAEEIISAGDPDAEGSLLIYNILVYFKIADFDFNLLSKKKVTRMLPLGMDKKSIVSAFDKRTPIEKDYPLIKQGLARTYADAIIGFNISQSTTIVNGSFLTVGRVQTATLNLIRQRELQITNFVPKEFLNIFGSFRHASGSFDATMFKKLEDGKITTHLKHDFNHEQYLNPLINKEFKVTDTQKTEKTTQTPLLPNMNDVLKKASILYGKTMDAKSVTAVLQKLYEAKAISYPRTENRHLPLSMKNEVSEILEKFGQKMNVTGFVFDSSRIYNDSRLKGESHFAIYPLTTDPKIEKEGNEEKVFNLIRDWFIISFLPPFTYYSTSIIVSKDNFNFKAVGQITIKKGYKSYSSPLTESKDDVVLPNIDKEQHVLLERYKSQQGKTAPPKAMTEVVLLDLMENIHRLYNKENDQTVEGFSLGTPATRSSMIELLLKRDYIQKKVKKLECTPKGIGLVEFISDDISLEITAQFERKLRLIGKNQKDYKKFLQEIELMTASILDKHKKMTVKERKSFTSQNLKEREITTFPSNHPIGYKTLLDGAEYIIWINSYGKKITQTQAKKLFEGECLKNLKLVSKNNKPYTGNLTFNKGTNKLELSFPPR